jgi:hypothetical protein
LSSDPTEISVDPNVFGFTMRAWSISGSTRFPTNVAVPVAIGGIVAIGCDVPITVYWLTGFVGGLPPTVIPPPIRSPVTGIDRFSCFPPMSWP